MFLESDDIFAGNPRDNFFDIVYNANRNLVENEIENLIERLALLEFLLEQNKIEDVDKKILTLKYNDEKKLELAKKDMFIHLTANIVSQNE